MHVLIPVAATSKLRHTPRLALHPPSTAPMLKLYVSCNYIQSYLELFNIWNTSLWKYTCICTWNYSTYLL
jgi:hypothetical protein